VFVVCVEMEERGHMSLHFLLFCTGPPQNEGGQTDILIRLHASLEVRTRDDLCRSMFAQIHGRHVGRLGECG
jgi:hypothetical protein